LILRDDIDAEQFGTVGVGFNGYYAIKVQLPFQFDRLADKVLLVLELVNSQALLPFEGWK